MDLNWNSLQHLGSSINVFLASISLFSIAVKISWEKQLGRERVNFLSVPDCRLLGSQGIRKLKQLILSSQEQRTWVLTFIFSSVQDPQIQGMSPPTLDNNTITAGQPNLENASLRLFPGYSRWCVKLTDHNSQVGMLGCFGCQALAHWNCKHIDSITNGRSEEG